MSSTPQDNAASASPLVHGRIAPAIGQSVLAQHRVNHAGSVIERSVLAWHPHAVRITRIIFGLPSLVLRMIAGHSVNAAKATLKALRALSLSSSRASLIVPQARSQAVLIAQPMQ